MPRLQRLARIYNVPVDQLLPRDRRGPLVPSGTDRPPDERGRQPPGAHPAPGRGQVVHRLTKPRGDRLRARSGTCSAGTLASIQVQRQDFNGRMLTVRTEDIEAIGRFFDLNPEAIRDRLETLGLCLHR